MDRHRGLVVRRRGENLALARGDGGIALNKLGEHAAHGFNAQGERRHVKQQHILHVAGEDAALDSGAHGYDFVGVHRAVGLLAEEFAHHLLDQRHTGHAADQDDFVDLVGVKAGVGQSLVAGLNGTIRKIADQGFQLGPAELDQKMLGAVLVGGDEGQVDLGLHSRGQVFLGLFRGFLQALEGHAVLGQINAVFLFEFFHQPVDDALVEVFAAQEGVAVGGAHFHDVVAHFQNGNIEGAAAQVEDGDLFIGFFVRTVGQRGGRGLVDDALDFQAGDAAGVLGGLALGVVEVGGHGDDRFGDRLAQIGFGVGLEFGQDHGRNLGRAVDAAVHFHPGVVIGGLGDEIGGMLFPAVDFRAVEFAAHQAFDGENGAFGVGHGLALGDFAHQPFLVGKSDHRRGGAAAFGIGDAFGVLALHDVNAGVCGTQVNTDDFGHMCILLREI